MRLKPICLSLAFSLALPLTLIASPATAASLDHKIGQMLMLGFQGSSAKSPGAKRLASQIAKGQVGGVVFLGYNFRSKAGVKSLTSSFRRAAGSNKIFIAVDMEGGSVQRLGRKLGYASVPSPRSIAKRQSPKAAYSNFKKLAQISKSAGFNMNLAPTIDLATNPNNPVITKWGRAFSADPAKVTAFGASFVKAHKAYRVMPVLKHFPGHGSSSGDSHYGFVDITKSWKAVELKPFKNLIKQGLAPAIMPGHLVHRKIAKEGVPVSISRSAISGMLRGQLGYGGLIISDDLQMAAIAKRYTYSSTLIRAVNAGLDILMISNSRKPDPNLVPKTIAIIKKAVASGKISKATIDRAYARIQRAKSQVW